MRYGTLANASHHPQDFLIIRASIVLVPALVANVILAIHDTPVDTLRHPYDSESASKGQDLRRLLPF